MTASPSVSIPPNKVEWIYRSCIQRETYRGLYFHKRRRIFQYILFWLISKPFVRVIFSADCITRECRGRRGRGETRRGTLIISHNKLKWLHTEKVTCSNVFVRPVYFGVCSDGKQTSIGKWCRIILYLPIISCSLCLKCMALCLVLIYFLL